MKAARLLDCREERLDLRSQRSVVTARLQHERCALRRRARERGLDDFLDAMPGGGVHQRRLRSSARS